MEIANENDESITSIFMGGKEIPVTKLGKTSFQPNDLHLPLCYFNNVQYGVQ